MKILHLISSCGYFGAENVVVELAESLIASGIEARVGVINNTYNSHMEICDVAKSRNIPCAAFDCSGIFDLRTIIGIRRLVRLEKIDIVHSHGYKSNFYVFAATLFSPVKRIATVHNWVRTDLKLGLYAAMDKLILRRFGKIVVVSDPVARELGSSGIPKDKIIFICNGINLKRFSGQEENHEFRKGIGIKDGERVVGTIGRLSPEKNQISLVRAFAKVNLQFQQLKLLIVGDGPDKEQLRSEAKKLGLGGRVIFTGKRNDIPELLGIMDVFVLPSKLEAMPMALLEAMAARKSIVATRVGEVPGIITHEKEGILVEADNVAKLSEALSFILTDDNAAKRLAENAYRKALDFSSEKMAREYLEKVYLL